MAFEPGRRRGRYWEDAKTINSLLQKFNFNTTGSSERDFEIGIATILDNNKDKFNSKVITQTHKTAIVNSIYCFGKKHRPDMALDENGIAMEVKFVTYAGLKSAIGQGHLYRLRYRFVFLILVISAKRRIIYEDLISGKESELEDALQHLADTMNVFTYIAPAFKTKPGQNKCVIFFEQPNILSS